MKYYETTCQEYITAAKRFDMHPELEPVSSKMPKSLSQLGNIILYGPSGAGKYTQFLRLIEKYAIDAKKGGTRIDNTLKQREQGRIGTIMERETSVGIGRFSGETNSMPATTCARAQSEFRSENMNNSTFNGEVVSSKANDSFNWLKTEKMTAATDKQKYEYHISDIHYEIDLSLLGCESKKMWNECFFQIVDIVSTKSSKCGIILCKNFQSIHSELLEVFYSYMQHCRALSIHIVFAILTEHVSFIPNRIIQCCKLISVKKPSAELYLGKDASILSLLSRKSLDKSKMNFGESKMNESKMTESKITLDETNMSEPNKKCKDFDVFTLQKSHKSFLRQIHPSSRDFFKSTQEDVIPEYILNIKETNVISKVDSPPKDVFNIVCDNIIAKMVQHNTLDIISLRDNLYDILLYGLDITECLWYILYYFVESEILVDENGEVLSEIMDKMNAFLKYYNNNYRPIYHLESMFIYLITKIYRYPSSPNEPKTSI